VKRAIFPVLAALSLALAAQLGYSAGSQSHVIEIRRMLQRQEQELQTLRAQVTALAEQPPSDIRPAVQARAPLSPETPRMIPTNDGPPLHSAPTSAAIPEAISTTSENIAARIEASRLIETAVSAGQWTQSDASQLHQLLQNTTTGDRRLLIKKLAVAINEGSLKVLAPGRMY
jgi:hypothetical protein